MNWEDQKKLSDAAFKELSGVKRETFEQMLTILEKQYQVSHESGGRPPKPSACDTLLITLHTFGNTGLCFILPVTGALRKVLFAIQ
jgi:hypothetical protein